MPTSVLEGVGRLFKVAFGLLAIAVGLIVVGTGVLYYHFAKDLPRLGDIGDYKPLVVSEVYAGDGKTKIGEFWQECRFLLPYEKIPRRVIDAFVASEDERFWDHKGVDFKSILRAFFKNLRAGKVVQGGSTITQQVTRSLVLSRERSFDRKVKEAILATQIEQNLAKEQILTIYLNQIFLGNRAHGVQAAARNYFRKDVTELNLAETAMIAGLPSAPTAFSPLANPGMARVRQQHVLFRMLENRYISKAEYEEALKTPLTLYRAGIDKDFNDRYAPYFVEHVRRTIEQSYGQQTLYGGGLKIYTTVDLDAYRAADRAVKRGLLEIERRKGFRGPVEKVEADKIREFADRVHRELTEWDEPVRMPPDPAIPPLSTPIEDYRIYKGVVSAVDDKGAATVLVGRAEGTIPPANYKWTGRTPKVGEIYWVRKIPPSEGGFLFTIEVEPKLEAALFSFSPLTGEVKAMIGGFSFKRSEFNRATQAIRQPGSAFKPVVYAAALDKGYTPATTVIDAPVAYKVGRNRVWSPENYSRKHNGPMPVRSAITHSNNVIAVKVFHDIGIDYTVAYARKLGLTTPIARYLSTALGASDVTLLDLTRAYSAFPSGGVRPPLLFIRRIVDKDGNVLEENRPAALDPAHVFDFHEGGGGGFNGELLAEGEKAIEKEKLRITPEEKRILYGASIPPGHVISPQTAFLMTDLLSDVVDHGTGYKAKELKRPAAGKTGTTNDESDAWFVAFTPDLIAGVWTGYDSRKKIGPGMTGGVVSAPIWLYYMQEVLKDRPVLEFAKPTNVKLANIDSMTGGSALEDARPEPEDLDVPTGEAPPSRGVDFLFKDLDSL
jgi:penicillin-binding protein 1A